MAKAIIGGLLSNGFPASNIYVAEPYAPVLDTLRTTYPGIRTSTTNTDAILFTSHPSGKPADVVLLAVKPQVMKTVAEGLSEATLSARPVVITIAAGIRVADLARWLCSSSTKSVIPAAIVRVMPNTPALVSEGASGLWADHATTTPEQRDLAFQVVNVFSKRAYWLEKESLLDVVTGISGM